MYHKYVVTLVRLIVPCGGGGRSVGDTWRRLGTSLTHFTGAHIWIRECPLRQDGRPGSPTSSLLESNATAVALASRSG